MKAWAQRFAEVRKMAAAAVGVIAEVVDAGLVHGTALRVAAGIIAVTTVAGVYAVPNRAPVRPPGAQPPAPDPSGALPGVTG